MVCFFLLRNSYENEKQIYFDFTCFKIVKVPEKSEKVSKNRMDYGAIHKGAMSDELIRIIKF